MNSLVSSLFKNGHYISYLLSESKTKVDSDDNFDNLIHEVIESTKQVLNSLKNHSQLPDTFPREDIFPKVLDKIKTTLEIFQKLNNTIPNNVASEFKNLEEEIDKFRNEVKQKSSKNVDGAESDTVDDPIKFLWDDHHLENDSSSLDEKQKECLLFCSDLLKCKNQNQNRDMVRISRRKLIHWWIGFGSIDSPTEGKEVLEKLVEEGFIIPNADIPRLSNISKGKGYIIHAKNMPKEKSKANESPKQDASSDEKKDRVGLPLHFKKWSRIDKIPAVVVVVINIDTYTLNENTLKNFMKTDVVILNLGTWPHNPKKKVKSTKYVVVEDIDALKSFLGHSWPYLKMLSFQGIGGIVKLPEAVYNISSLKVLDLKACPNLEILPPGINSLKQLTHLDLSECYLLDHIPKGLRLLTNLQVLKGFIINYNINSNNECAFDDLAKLTCLIKLAVRARTTNFPTISNVKTMNEMTQLKYLKVVWVQSINSYDIKINPKKIGTNVENKSEGALKLPGTLEKLELQAASEINASQMLDLISYKSGYCPKKLYIRGGDLWKLDPYTYCFPEVETLRFRYLPKLHIKWSDCQSMFPKLSHLEVLECPKLVCFPCDDNGMWNKSDES